MSTNFDWKGFNTFINVITDDNDKQVILCIFAKHLYNVTSTTDYYYRFIEQIIIDIDNTNTSTIFSTQWKDVKDEIDKDTKLITNIGEKLLVLASKHNHFKTTTDVTNAVTNINNITDAETVTYSAESNKINEIKNISVAKAYKTKLSYNWGTFYKLVTDIKNDDAKLYVMKYFASLQVPDSGSDDYINILEQIKNNANTVKIIEKFKNESSSAKLNEVKSKLLFLFEKLQLKTYSKDCLNVFTGERPSGSYSLSGFNKDDMPSGWENYDMISVASYNVDGLDDGSGGVDATKKGNVNTFLNYIATGNAPYDKFRPAIITLQKTNLLLQTDTETTALETSLSTNYKLFSHYDETGKARNLITLLTKDYKNIQTISGYLDTAKKEKLYIASIIHDKNVIVFNVVNTGTDTISLDDINNEIDNIKRKDKNINNYDVIITTDGSFNYRTITSEYEYSKSKYNKNDVDGSYIISIGFKKDDMIPYDFEDTKVDFKSNYGTYQPIGKRLFKDPSRAIFSTPAAPYIPVKLTTLFSSIANELDALTDKDIQKIVASVRLTRSTAPPKKKTTSVKAAPAKPAATPAATPPAIPAKGPTLDITKIEAIDFSKVNLETTAPGDFKNYVVYKKSVKFDIKVIRLNVEEYINVDEKNLYENNSDNTKFIIKFDVSGTDYYITWITITDKIQTTNKGKAYDVKHKNKGDINIQKGGAELLKKIDLEEALKDYVKKDDKTSPPTLQKSLKYDDFTSGIDSSYTNVLVASKGSPANKKIVKLKIDSTGDIDGTLMSQPFGPYNLQFTYKSNLYNIHNLFISYDKSTKKNKLMYRDTTPPVKDNPYIDITKYATFS